jgi:hypothetical protein
MPHESKHTDMILLYSWDEKAYKYSIEESQKSADEANELDQYVFVVRARIGQYVRSKWDLRTHEDILDKKSATNTVYIDIKSEWLRDVLRMVLKGVHGISAKEDKPSASSPSLTMRNQPLTWAQVEQNLLYHFLPELKSHRSSTDPLDLICAKHLDILIQHIMATYADTRTRIFPLLVSGEITYDLLWALFKPNGTKKQRCIKYDFGEERTTSDGVVYFHINRWGSYWYGYFEIPWVKAHQLSRRLGMMNDGDV